MFTTTGRARTDLGVFGLSIPVIKAGDQVTVERVCDSQWRVLSGPMRGTVVSGDQLDFDLPEPAPDGQGRGKARILAEAGGVEWSDTRPEYFVEIACPVCRRLHGSEELTREAAEATAALLESAPYCLDCIDGGTGA